MAEDRINIGMGSFKLLFQHLVDQIKKLIAAGGGGQAIFQEALKIAEDALSNPPGVGMALAIIRDVMELISKGLATEHAEIKAKLGELEAREKKLAEPAKSEAPKEATKKQ